jgi:DNA adenine methylase
MVKNLKVELNNNNQISQNIMENDNNKKTKKKSIVKKEIIQEVVPDIISENIQETKIEVKPKGRKTKIKETVNEVNPDVKPKGRKTKIKETVSEVEPEVNPDVKPIVTKISLSPLIKWSGGKSEEIKHFEKHIPKKYNYYIEPFIGGGAVFFHLNPEKAVISDVHTELIDLYKSIKDGKINEIYKFMEDNTNTEEAYYKVRDKMEVKTPLDNAKRFYYLRKTCFRGMLRYNKDGKFNIPYGRYKTINYSDLNNNNYECLMKRTDIFKDDFEHVFKNYNDENNFMFLDPPYDSEFTDYGYCKFGQEEHKKLAKCFKETKIKCMMIIGKTKFIEELYKDYIVEEYQKKYRFKLYGGRVGDEINVKHLIIKNY